MSNHTTHWSSSEVSWVHSSSMCLIYRLGNIEGTSPIHTMMTDML